MPVAAKAWIGCSGWHYRHWGRGVFYPGSLPSRQWFAYYAARFDTVEINNTFYRLPERTTFVAWRRQAPPGFRFALKASRYLTHLRKLRSPADPLRRFFLRARALGPHLGPVLYQLPPRWGPDLARLEAFLAVLPRSVPQAIEFRDAAWYADRTFALLERHGVALCLHDMPDSAPPRALVGPFAYVRFHGTTARYGGRYGERQLAEWAEWMAGVLARGREVYAYFNNDAGGHAPHNALTLRALLSTRGAQGTRGPRRTRRAPRRRRARTPGQKA
ncbi:MAG TPA: DUF72 domain-containing protein [Vicinamibacterales bacterium]|nr:DUF72 domain-containing protein [Vicinamibacterales bacterium]